MNMIKSNGGFTLVELIVVIAILAILAAVAVPAYNGYITKAQEAADITVLDAVKQYASIIDRETVGGWKLDCIQQIPVTKKAGCLAGLMGTPDITVTFNMLVFVKED